MDNIAKNTRLYLLRILSAIGVIVIHVSVDTTALGITMNSIAEFCVPAFVILSGYFVLPKADSASYVLRKTLRIICIMLVWAPIYYWYYYATGQKAFDGIQSILEYIVTGPVFFWYFYMTIGLYIFAPVFKVFADNASKKLYIYAIVLCLFFGSFITILVKSGYVPLLNTVIDETKIPYMLAFPGLFLFGGYVQRYGIERKNRYFIYALGLALELAAILLSVNAFNQKNYTGLLGSFFAPSAVMLGISVFTLLYYLPENKLLDSSKAQNILAYIGSKTLGIFIIHPFANNFMKINKILSNSPCIKVITIFLVSLAITIILKKIPIIKKLL